jgi:4-hydroxybenzoyl-CoA reductase subunit alpha
MTPAAGRASVGVRTPLIDGVDKVTGRARYTADLPLGPALVGRILRSPVAHGLIRGIDTTAARALPGVRAVITGADFAAPYGVIPIAQNEWPLARDRVRYRGEPLAAVAAIDEATAEAALRTIVLDIDPEVGLTRFSAPADRLEAEPLAFHRRVREHFLALSRRSPERYLVLDATAPVDAVSSQIRGAVLERLP